MRVFPDDHIEWNVITNLLKQYNCEVLCKEDYLHYNNNYDLSSFNEFKDKYTDMTVLVARKK